MRSLPFSSSMMRSVRYGLTAVVLCLMVSRGGELSWAKRGGGVETVIVPLHGSAVVDLRSAPGRVSMSSSEIAEVKPLDGLQLLITGKALGQAQLAVWDRGERMTTYQISVELPVRVLQDRINAILPNEEIAVSTVGGTIVLSGQVSDPVILDRAKELVEAHLQGINQQPRVLNFLTVRGMQQVQLRVKVADVSRSALRKIGVNFWSRKGNFSGGMVAPGVTLGAGVAPDMGGAGGLLEPGGGTITAAGATPTMPLLASPFPTDSFGLHFATQGGFAFPMSIAVGLLQMNGLAKILSEPTLVAYSGQEANFLVGGEFPVPIPQALGQTAIEFKKYGVQLKFTPLVMGSETIHLKVSVIVSDKDVSGAVQIQGTNVPALATRHSETTVRLKNGQSFAIAGLLQDRIESSSSKIPLLGDIPILGMLFRSSSFHRQETELVVLVTAHLVQPLRPGEVPPLPGEDEITDPSSVSFFLLGTIDAGRKTEVHRGPAGPVGFER